MISFAKGCVAEVKKLASEKKFCFLCMTEHVVETVELLECANYKGEEVYFHARYDYCTLADEYVENESMIKINRAAIKEAYQYYLSSKNEN
jgi:hypothetical protein